MPFVLEKDVMYCEQFPYVKDVVFYANDQFLHSRTCKRREERDQE